jgi:hypothetical protein
MPLAGCGGSAVGAGNQAVAEVGSSRITRAAVSHWMTALAGPEYYNASGEQPLPEGLLSDPANYPRCVSRLGAATGTQLAKTTPPTVPIRLTGPRLLRKCQQLNEALKTQATAFLVETQQILAASHENGLTPTTQEVQALYSELVKRVYHTETAFKASLQDTRLTLPDYMLEVQRDTIGRKVMKLKPQARTKLTDSTVSWTEKTRCQPSYTVEHCQEFKGGPTYPRSPPASIEIEQLVAITTGRCYDSKTCHSQ